jgi:hypothetical protein
MKCQKLAFDIMKQGQLDMIVLTLSVLYATGFVPNMLKKSLARFSLPQHIMYQAQKVVTLDTCSTARKFPSDEDHLLTKGADKS